MDIMHEETTHLHAKDEPFALLGLKKEILLSLKKAGFVNPSPIQEEVIPLILSGADVIGHAQTGTGKTAAFALPALNLLKNTGTVEALVITPTRELASQVSEEIIRLGGHLRVKVATIYGGKSFFTQIDAVKRGAHIIVATPGRLLDLLQGKKLGTFAPSLVIIDEADEMLDMGFLEDLQAIFEFLPKERQTLMFSATMPPAIQSLAKRILKSPHVVKAAQTQATNEDITQHYCVLHDYERDDAVIRFFEANDLGKSIIFCKTKKEVDRLSQVLTQRGHIASGLHGDMEQPQRELVINAFRSGKCQILVATDIAARGLNIVDISHVINYHIPFDAENYVHRIGRTGRAGNKGTSITFVTPKEHGKLIHFHKTTGGKLERKWIPSKKEIRTFQMRKILSQIQEHIPSDEIAQIIDSLTATLDPISFATKLLSWTLNKHPIPGPETIGITDSIQAHKSPAPRSFDKRTPHHRGRMERRDPDLFGNYPKKKFEHPKKKKFSHPAEERKAKKSFKTF